MEENDDMADEPTQDDRDLPAFPRLWELGQAAAVSAGATLLARLFIPIVGAFGGDSRWYTQMAIAPLDPVATPFAFRVLTPWLVRVIGTDPLPTFHLVSLGFLAAAGFFVYLITRGIGGSHVAGLLATAGLLTLRGLLFFFYDPYLSDPAALSLTAAAFAALVWGATSVIPTVAAFWALSREIWAGFAIPAYMWLRNGLFDARAAVRVALMLIPAFIVYEMVIELVPQEGAHGLGRISWSVFERVLQARITEDLPWYATYTFAGSLGVWWLLALSAPAPGGALWWWMVPVFGQFLLGADWSRFTLYAFVVILPVGAIAAWEHPRRNVLIGVVALQLIAPVADVLVDDRLKLNQIQPSLPISVALMVLTAIVLWAPARWWPATAPEATARP